MAQAQENKGRQAPAHLPGRSMVSGPSSLSRNRHWRLETGAGGPGGQAALRRYRIDGRWRRFAHTLRKQKRGARSPELDGATYRGSRG